MSSLVLQVLEQGLAFEDSSHITTFLLLSFNYTLHFLLIDLGNLEYVCCNRLKSQQSSFGAWIIWN